MRRTHRTSCGIAALVVGLIGVAVPVEAASESEYEVAGCERADLGGRSVARVWDDTLLELIRQVVPAPTVHARNLFHTSVAMWDAWAAYDPAADGYLVTEKLDTEDVTAAREDGDQLRRLSAPSLALRHGLGPSGHRRAARRRDGVAVLPNRLRVDGWRFACGPRQPHRRHGHRGRP